MLPDLRIFLSAFTGGILGALATLWARVLWRRYRRSSDTTSWADSAAAARLKDHEKRISQLEGNLKDMIRRTEVESKTAGLKQSTSDYFSQRLSSFRHDIEELAERFETELRSLEDRMSNRILLSSTSRVPPTQAQAYSKPVSATVTRTPNQEDDMPTAEVRPSPYAQQPYRTESPRGSPTIEGSNQEIKLPPSSSRSSIEREPLPHPQASASYSDFSSQQATSPRELDSLDQRTKTDISQLIIQHFDDIDEKSIRRLDVMKRMYRDLSSHITDIEDSNGAYLFKVVGSVWLVHPRPNASLDHFWEKAFPRAESYSRVIQRVTRLARIRRINELEYEVLQEGSFAVR